MTISTKPTVMEGNSMSSTELITLEQVEDVLLHGGALDVVSDEAMQADMVRRILESETLTDVFRDFKATPAKDLEGVRVVVNGIAWVRSAFSEGPGVYALLTCRVPGEPKDVVVSMGGRTLMAAFLWAQRQEAMPFEGTFVSERSRTNPEHSFWTFKLAGS